MEMLRLSHEKFFLGWIRSMQRCEMGEELLKAIDD
jgi:hypothetical protein